MKTKFFALSFFILFFTLSSCNKEDDQVYENATVIGKDIRSNQISKITIEMPEAARGFTSSGIMLSFPSFE